MFARSLVLAVPLIFSACVSLPEDAGLSDVQSMTATAFPATVQWPGVSISETDATARIETLLGDPLTEEGVLEIAMLSNRKLRRTLYGLKAAKGDFTDRASPPNPFVSAVVFDVQGEDITNLDFGAGFELLDLFFLPRRIKMSKAGFEAAKLEAARDYIDFASGVRIAYYDSLAARQMAGLMQQANTAATASANASQALFEAGNIPEIQFNRDKLLAAQTRLEALRAEQAFLTAKENLIRLMGLNASQAGQMTLKGRLRHAPKDQTQTPEIHQLTQSSLGLASQDAQIHAAALALGITDITSLIGDLELELSRERGDGEWETGFGAGFQLPVFNPGQGKREAARSRLQAMIENRMASTIDLGSYRRELTSDLETKRLIAVKQRREVLPLAGQVLQGSQLDYNAMQIGVFGLLEAKRNQLAAGQAYIAALRDYWIARARMDQMIAGGSPASAGATLTDPSMAISVSGGDH